MERTLEPTGQLDPDELNQTLERAVFGREPTTEASHQYVGITDDAARMIVDNGAEKGISMVLNATSEGEGDEQSGVDIASIFGAAAITNFTLGVIFERQRLQDLGVELPKTA